MWGSTNSEVPQEAGDAQGAVAGLAAGVAADAIVVVVCPVVLGATGAVPRSRTSGREPQQALAAKREGQGLVRQAVVIPHDSKDYAQWARRGPATLKRIRRLVDDVLRPGGRQAIPNHRHVI